jgi:phage gpG-like protein
VLRRTKPRNTPRGQTAAGRKILFGETRNLSRSIDYDTANGKVTIYSDVHYAQYHNEGTEKLPQRQFIGDSDEMNRLVIAEIERKLKNIPKK